jgi:hypothetical protein
MQDSYPMSWKDLYLQVLLESDDQKLTELVHAIEQAMLRALSDSTTQERSDMEVVKTSLLSIKTCKLGWPPLQ